MQTIITDKDFVDTEIGLTLLDAVTMRLQAIGDTFNQIKKQNDLLINEQLEIDADPIIGFRNFISHHYELLDYQIIFKICKTNLPPLRKKIEHYLNNSKH